MSVTPLMQAALAMPCNVKRDHKTIDDICKILAMWNLQAYGTYEAIAKLNVITGCTQKNYMSALRSNAEFVQDWRLAALRGGADSPPKWREEIVFLDYQHKILKKAKEPFYEPCVVLREKILAEELGKIDLLIHKLSRTYFRQIVFSYSREDVASELRAHAIKAFRWIYPFADRPGPIMTRSVENYVKNIRRQSFNANDKMTLNGELNNTQDNLSRAFELHDSSGGKYISKTPLTEVPIAEVLEPEKEDGIFKDISELDNGIMRDLIDTLNRDGEDAFANEAAKHIDASPQRILRIMKGKER